MFGESFPLSLGPPSRVCGWKGRGTREGDRLSALRRSRRPKLSSDEPRERLGGQVAGSATANHVPFSLTATAGACGRGLTGGGGGGAHRGAHPGSSRRHQLRGWMRVQASAGHTRGGRRQAVGLLAAAFASAARPAPAHAAGSTLPGASKELSTEYVEQFAPSGPPPPPHLPVRRRLTVRSPVKGSCGARGAGEAQGGQGQAEHAGDRGRSEGGGGQARGGEELLRPLRSARHGFFIVITQNAVSPAPRFPPTPLRRPPRGPNRRPAPPPRPPPPRPADR